MGVYSLVLAACERKKVTKFIFSNKIIKRKNMVLKKKRANTVCLFLIKRRGYKLLFPKKSGPKAK